MNYSHGCMVFSLVSSRIYLGYGSFDGKHLLGNWKFLSSLHVNDKFCLSFSRVVSCIIASKNVVFIDSGSPNALEG
jgi:hypothetical protein